MTINELSHNYRVNVAVKDRLLEGPDVSVQDFQPLSLVLDLVHVDVPRRHVLVAAFQAGVLRLGFE